MKSSIPFSVRQRLIAIPVLAALSVLTSCPSESTQGSASSVDGLEPSAAGPSVLDEVQIASPEDSLEEATQEIDESNVLEALKAMELDSGN